MYQAWPGGERRHQTASGKNGEGWGGGGQSKEVFTSSIFLLSFLSSSLASEMSMLLMIKF